MTYRQWVQEAIIALQRENAASPCIDAEVLLQHVTGQDRTGLYIQGDAPIPESMKQELFSLLNRRCMGEPIAYLCGVREFWSLPLQVTDATLIPRPESERLVEIVLDLFPEEMHCQIVDLGTGSGALSLALGHERPLWRLIGIDNSISALQIAQKNANLLGIMNVCFIESDWFTRLSELHVQGRHSGYDAIISNPPYLSAQDPALLCGDLKFEPQQALIAGENGLEALAYIVQHAFPYLKKGGWLLLEHGWTQGPAVRALFEQQGYQAIMTYRDYSGRERVTLGRTQG